VPARTNATGAEATASTAGILRPEEFARHAELRRSPAGAAVAHWVENHWALRWDLPEGRSFASQVLPHPTCSLTVERGTHPRPAVPAGEVVVVTGLATERFDVDVRGSGRVAGVRFRPGGLAALTGGDASGWTDATVPATDVIPADAVALLADADLADDPTAWADEAEAVIAKLASDRTDPRYDELLGIVADMLGDRGLVAVAQVGDRHGLSARSLQRLFTQYVGIGPKWVLARYRMHDAVTEIDEGYDGPLLDLALRYGWYDQAHFTRDFTALVGVTPGAYRDARSVSRGGGLGRGSG
jgi:AraC-like DNA-binding protein